MWIWLTAAAGAATIEVTPADDLFAILDAAQPGDEIVLRAGVYVTQQGGGSWYRRVQLDGTPQAPIVVRAADGELVVIEGDPAGSQNVLNVAGSHYTWRGLEVRYGSHGVRVETSAHATFEDLHIHDVDGVGLSCNIPGSTYEDLTLRGNHVHHTGGAGECFYLGCNDDGCQMFDSLVEYNWCHDTGGSQGDGIELKTGSYNNIIRHNVVHDVNYPGITMYGALGRGDNRVEGNRIWNVIDNGIQIVGEVEVVGNVVFDVGNYGIQSKASQGAVPENLIVRNNTVVAGASACFKANDWAGLANGVVANNAFYCEGGSAINVAGGPGGAAFVRNVIVGSSNQPGQLAGVSVAADLANVAAHNAWPTAGSALIGAADPAWASLWDHNNATRDDGDPDVGAYERRGAANPWPPQAAQKPRILWLDVSPLIPGSSFDLQVRGAWPDRPVIFGWSTEAGPGPCPPPLGGLCLGLVDPAKLGTASPTWLGDAILTRSVPAGAPPVTASFQAGQTGARPALTNVATATVR